MRRSRGTRLGSVLVFGGLALAAACGRAPQGGPAPQTPGKALSPAASGTPSEATARRTPPPERPPPADVTAPMVGEPAPAVLREARLVPSSCEKAAGVQVDARVKEMRAALARAYKEWHDEQPECWRQDREEYMLRKQEEQAARRPRMMDVAPSAAWGSMAQGYGGGGLGAIGGARGAAGVSSGSPAPRPASKPAPKTATSASGTNTQVAGVDEADIVKTDGKYVYLAANGALRVVEAMSPRVVSVTRLEGTARELFVEGDRAVVYTSIGHHAPRCTYGYDCMFAGDGSQTRVTVLELGDRTAPKVVRTLDLSGSLVASRRIGRAVHTVVADGDRRGPPYATWPAGLDMCGVPEKTVRARLKALEAENERKIRAEANGFPTLREGGREKRMCEGLLETALKDGEAFTSVVSFDLTDDKAAPTTATLQSRPGAVFASADGLYVSVVHRKAGGHGWYRGLHPTTSEVSEIHKFRIGERPADTRYVASGVVPGHVLNQFSMDQWYGYLRIATTKGKVPDPNVASVVSVLREVDGNLVRVGAVDSIAPGEDIRAVRFDGDRGYVVTFKKTDPLFVMDLYDPSKPRVLGELKIPGFSTYMHRIDPEHLLSIGFDADDKGSFAYFDGVILQLFDVKNPTDPRLLHKEKIGSRGSSSEAATNHLAFNYFAERGLLAIPMTVCEGGGDGRAGELAFSGLLVYDVDVERGFTRKGGVDHGTKGVNCQTWWSNAQSAVKRSVFLDDLVYSIAGERVKVQRLGKLGVDVADLSLVP